MISKWKPVIRRLSFAGKIAKSVLKTACALAFWFAQAAETVGA